MTQFTLCDSDLFSDLECENAHSDLDSDLENMPTSVK